MKLDGRRTSRNVEDRRGKRSTGVRIGIGAIVILILTVLMGGDPSQILNQIMQDSMVEDTSIKYNDEDDVLGLFSKQVVASTEDIWTEVFREQLQAAYSPPSLVLFTGSTSSACGYAQSATGPFYCPGDRKIYIDLAFYDQLSQRFGASGDMAMAYVIAHEVGHHVQNLLGYTDQVHRQRGRISQEAYNQLSVRLELQADFLAGVWANREHQNFGSLEDGDIEEAMRAAHAVGDDNIQKQSQGYVVPESFTHGTSAQRMRWFKKGLATGDLRQGDTFSATSL